MHLSHTDAQNCFEPFCNMLLRECAQSKNMKYFNVVMYMSN